MGFFQTLAALAAIGSVPGAAAKSSRLDVINLPVGFMPEGIALAEAWTVYVGSLQGVGVLRTSSVDFWGFLGVRRHRSDKRKCIHAVNIPEKEGLSLIRGSR